MVIIIGLLYLLLFIFHINFLVCHFQIISFYFSQGHIYQGIKSNSKSRFATEDDDEIIGSEYGKWTCLIILIAIKDMFFIYHFKGVNTIFCFRFGR